MKKKILNIIIVLSIILCLAGCCTTYQEATEQMKNDDFGNGYFTAITKWRDTDNIYKIVYTNDTKVKYIIIYTGSRIGIAPLYNADGTLQIYEESEEKIN